MTDGTFTYAEITSQPAAWQEAVDVVMAQKGRALELWQALRPAQVVFTGCGSTHYLALTAAALLQALTKTPARGAPASEISLYPSAVLADPAHTLLVAISRSGTTSETIAAMRNFRAMGGAAVWSIGCYPDTPVIDEADFALVIPSAQEESIAQTRSFASMLLVVEALAAHLGGEEIEFISLLPKIGQNILTQAEPLVRELAGRLELERFFFLGSGPQYGIACEAMLKMKEMSLTASEAYHFLEFRHGPKSMVDEQTVVVGLLAQGAREQEQAVLEEMKGLGGVVLAIGPRLKQEVGGLAVTLPTQVPAWAMPLLYLPALQLLAYHRARAKGLDPDQPRNLDAVVVLEAVG